MDQGNLVSEQIAAGTRLVSEFDKTIPLRAAFWLKDADEGYWSIYLVSDNMNNWSHSLANKEIRRLIPPGSSVWLESADVRVLGSDTPLGKGAIEVQGRYKGTPALRLSHTMVGDVYPAALFFYAMPATAAFPV